MATIAVQQPYSLKQATLVVASDDYTATVGGVKFDPSSQAATWRGIGGNVLRDQSTAEWSCTLDLLQDLASTSLYRYLSANEGQKKACVFTPLAAGPSISATLTMSPATIGGTAGGEFAVASVTLAVDGKPAWVELAAVPLVAAASPSGAGTGALVTITGAKFSGVTGAAGVKFGATNATSYVVLSDATIVAVMPSGAAGAANITVTHPTSGTSAAFTYTRAA